MMKNDKTWTPDGSDYADVWAGQNPWHTLGNVPEGLAYTTRRLLAERLWKTMLKENGRFQIVLGPRRVGKTVCLYQTIQQLIEHGIPPQRLWFMRMDHPLFLEFSLGGWVKSLIDHVGATAENPLYLFLDEVNYSEKWDLWLKTFFDEKWPVRVAATSSSVAALRKGRLESGIGRWSEQFLTPYNYLEYQNLFGGPQQKPNASTSLHECISSAIAASAGIVPTVDKLDLFLLVGGFPEIIINELKIDDLNGSMLRSQQTLRNEAVQRVTGMDLPQVFHVRQPIELERLLYLLGGQMCGQYSPNSLAGSLSISRQTVIQYIDYLEKAFLIFTLPSFSNSEKAVQRRGRKVYFVDGAVRNAALQRGLKAASDPNEKGLLVENVVGAHLSNLTLQNEARLFHWREKQQEVDFVYDGPSESLAFEVTNGSKHSLKGLNAFREKYSSFENSCYLISATSRAMELPKNNRQGIGRLPLDVFLNAVSACHSSSLGLRLQ